MSYTNLSNHEPQDFHNFSVSFPQDHVIQVTLKRPEKLNCIDKPTSRKIAAIWELLDNDEELWIGVITGSGRAFCTGADLEEWNKMNETGEVNDMSAPGLAGLPRRDGKKPIMAAVNGLCFGGGFEMVANCDFILAAPTATFALPEVKRGIVPVAGSLPRLTRIIGLQRTMDLALTGRTVGAKTLHEWGLVTQIAENVVDATLELAAALCKNSPDALIVGRRAVRLAWEVGNVEEAVESCAVQMYPGLVQGSNFAEGIRAFVEKRAPRWTNPKL